MTNPTAASLIARSNRLGADPKNTNYAGGNTSAKGFAAAAAVPLSSIRQPSRMIGRTALRIVLEEAADPGSIPRQTVFPPELIARRSTTG